MLLAFALYRRDSSLAAGVIFAIGVLTLFFTRPYEGGVFTLVCLAVFGFRLWRKRPAAIAGTRVFLLSAAPVLVAGLLWAGWYDTAITGNPFRLPYLLHDAQYNTAALFWFLPLRSEPHSSHPRLAAQHSRNGEEFRFYRQVRAGDFYRTASDTLTIVVRIFGWTDRKSVV